MRRTLATTAAALIIGAAAAGPATAAPAYPPTPTGEVLPSVAPSEAPRAVTQNAAVDSLAFTGTDVAVVGGAAALLVAGGVVLVSVSRRRGERAV